MAKNDYHVIVYRILLYLYACLKGGEDVDTKRLDEIALAAGANERYWHYILWFDYQLDRHCSKTSAPPDSTPCSLITS